MRNGGAQVSRLIFILVLLAMAAVSASAQLTVINTPSTDTLQAKMFYIEADFSAKLKSYRNGGFRTYGYRTVYGVNRKTEAGVTLFYTKSGNPRVGSPIQHQAKTLFKREMGPGVGGGRDRIHTAQPGRRQPKSGVDL